jgi:hypothetical protein
MRNPPKPQPTRSNEARHYRVTFCCVTLFWLATATAVRADSLATLVPEDAGVCFQVEQLAQHLGEFRGSDLYARLAALPPLRAAVSGRIQQLRQFTTKLEKQLGVNTETLWGNVIGQEVLVAVWPPPEVGAEGPALFLVRSPAPEMLRQVFDHVVAEQRRAGRVCEGPLALDLADPNAHVAAICDSGNRPKVYLAVLGSLGVVSTSSHLIEHVIRAEHAPDAAAKSLATLPAYKSGQARLESGAVARVFLNPLPWRAQFEARPKPRDAREGLVRDTLLATWKASEYLVASLSIDREIHGEAYLQCNSAELPGPGRKLFESVAGESRLAERIPRETLVALAGRLDTQRLVQLLLELNRGEYLGSVGRVPPAWGAALALLGGLGPDVAVYLLAPEDSAGAAMGWPIQWLAAIGSRWRITWRRWCDRASIWPRNWKTFATRKPLCWCNRRVLPNPAER